MGGRETEGEEEVLSAKLLLIPRDLREIRSGRKSKNIRKTQVSHSVRAMNGIHGLKER